MGEGIRWVGLDVHGSRTAVAVLDTATGEVLKRTVHGRPSAVMELLGALDGPVHAVYEAGPTGYGLARRSRPGLEIAVCAPGMIPMTGGGSSSRVKTDARDALKLARLHHAGQLTLVTVPTVEQEQVRDLIRAREDVRADLMRARHRLGKLLLRRELYYPGRDRPWSAKHRDWLASLTFEDLATEATLPGLPARPRRAGLPPRPPRRAHRKARADMQLRRRGRAAALPARDRHADGD